MHVVDSQSESSIVMRDSRHNRNSLQSCGLGCNELLIVSGSLSPDAELLCFCQGRAKDDAPIKRGKSESLPIVRRVLTQSLPCARFRHMLMSRSGLPLHLEAVENLHT
jgi:hypothetical protein